ncbi:hypothetical protein GXM_00471 [Nostoc sphaeroides CCNUC1]|uniref:Uncharacterized protein n=1 Tax=Nostoc sphaeroides CCNUC1 TaxID=2653204 RepID=A0A5P8VRB9_9NOSO|nr:hypothetical protein GXM_00471 [Nostoc sphaeroides CCNUC1]
MSAVAGLPVGALVVTLMLSDDWNQSLSDLFFNFSKFAWQH